MAKTLNAENTKRESIDKPFIASSQSAKLTCGLYECYQREDIKCNIDSRASNGGSLATLLRHTS